MVPTCEVQRALERLTPNVPQGLPYVRHSPVSSFRRIIQVAEVHCCPPFPRVLLTDHVDLAIVYCRTGRDDAQLQVECNLFRESYLSRRRLEVVVPYSCSSATLPHRL